MCIRDRNTSVQRVTSFASHRHTRRRSPFVIGGNGNVSYRSTPRVSRHAHLSRAAPADRFTRRPFVWASISNGGSVIACSTGPRTVSYTHLRAHETPEH